MGLEVIEEVAEVDLEEIEVAEAVVDLETEGDPVEGLEVIEVAEEEEALGIEEVVVEEGQEDVEAAVEEVVVVEVAWEVERKSSLNLIVMLECLLHEVKKML